MTTSQSLGEANHLGPRHGTHVIRCTVEVWERKSNFVPYFVMYVITYPNSV